MFLEFPRRFRFRIELNIRLFIVSTKAINQISSPIRHKLGPDVWLSNWFGSLTDVMMFSDNILWGRYPPPWIVIVENAISILFLSFFSFVHFDAL